MVVKLVYPKMNIYDCSTYPPCELNKNDLETNPKIKRISNINEVSTFFIGILHTPIDSEQKLLVLECIRVNGNRKYWYE